MVSSAIERMREQGRAYLKKHPDAFNRSGSSSSRNSNYNTGTKGSTTLYYIKDPVTGKTTVTGSPELASSSYRSGSVVEASRNYGSSSRSSYNPSIQYDQASAAIAKAEQIRLAEQERQSKIKAEQERRTKQLERQSSTKSITTPQQFQDIIRQQSQSGLTQAQIDAQKKLFGIDSRQLRADVKPLYQTGADKLIESYQEQRNTIAQKEMDDAIRHLQNDINKGDITLKRAKQVLITVQNQIENRYNATVKTYSDKLQAQVKSPYFETRQTDTLKGGIPYLEVFYINPETDKERKATVAERKQYQLGEFAVGEVRAKTYTQLQEEAGWLGKVTTPLQRAKITGAVSTGITPVKAGITSYQEIEKSTSDWLYDVSGFTEEKHKRQMADIERSTEYLKDVGVPSFLAETGGAIARGTGKIGKGAIDKPLKTTAVYGTTAAVMPSLAISSIAAPEAIGYGLTKAGKGISKVDIFGLPVGETVSSLLPKTAEELMVDALFMKGAGKVISKAPKIVKRGVTRGMTVKGSYGLTFGETPEEKAMGLTEMGMGLGFEFGEYAGRRLRLHWDKNQVIKYSVEERAKFEAEKIKGVKYKMNPRPLKEQTQLRKYVKEARELWKYKAETREIDFSGMERITQEARKPTFDWLKANKKSLVVGGTAGTRTQTLDPSKYVPHDIDIFTLRGSPEKYAKSLYQSLWKAGVKGYQLKGSKIYAPNGKDAIEFHNYDEFLKANIEQVAPWYQTSKYGLTKTPSGIKVLSMRSQIGQKTLGYARYGETRLKDWLYVSKEAKPTQLKAKASYEKARLPDPFKFEPIMDFGVSAKRVPKKKVAYETFDFGLDLGVVKPITSVGKPSKTYKKYQAVEDFLYSPYKPAYKPTYKPYKKTTYKPAYKPVLSLITPPYKPYKKPTYKPYKRVTPGYKVVIKKPTYKAPKKIIDPFDSLAGAFPFDRKKTIKKKVSIKKISKKKKPKYVARITGFEAALGLGPRYVKAGTKFTGFEAVRGKAVRRPMKKIQKKKKETRKQTPKRDELSGFLY